jgi:alanine-glyoxylate transaminase / serine-glyoxylate transaminase / serine-pyruvate transaminase
MEITAPNNFIKPLNVSEKVLMGAGPSNFPARIRKAMSLPVLGHMHPETFKIMDDIKEGVKYLFQTRNALTFCISGPGHAGMECAFSNLVEDGDVVLIASTGIWGNRAENMAKRINANVKILLKTPGEQVTLEETRKCFEIFKPKVFFITHGESSTGMLQNLSGFGDLCREFNLLLVVDCVITMGCVPLFVDKWKIDVAYTGTQKVLNAPPGITPITFSTRAL